MYGMYKRNSCARLKERHGDRGHWSEAHRTSTHPLAAAAVQTQTRSRSRCRELNLGELAQAATARPSTCRLAASAHHDACHVCTSHLQRGQRMQTGRFKPGQHLQGATLSNCVVCECQPYGLAVEGCLSKAPVCGTHALLLPRSDGTFHSPEHGRTPCVSDQNQSLSAVKSRLKPVNHVTALVDEQQTMH